MEGPRDVAGRSLGVSGLRKELDAAVHRQIAQKRKSLQRSRLQNHEPDHDSASEMTKRITLSWIQLSPNSTGSFNPELPLPKAEEVPRW